MFRSIPNSVVLYPSDAVATENAVKLASNNKGIFYIKGGRNPHPIVYSNNEVFEIGKSKFVRFSEKDVLTIVTAGAPLFEVIEACIKLEKVDEKIRIRIIDLFSVKPIDSELLRESSACTNGLVFIVEDCYEEGNLGDAVSSALKKEKGVKIYHKAIDSVPRSGTPKDLYDMYGLNSRKIYFDIRKILKENNLIN